MASKRQLVLILAVGHTGSTLLDLLIGSHSHCTSLGEFIHFKKYYKNRRFDCPSCGNDCECWRKFYEHAASLPIYEAAFGAFGTPILIDSSKQINWARKALSYADTTPETQIKIIRLQRNGIATLNKAVRKHGRVPKRAVINWVRVNQEIDAFLSSIGNTPKLTVSYEDLCTQTANTLQKVCSFLEIPYEEGMEDFWTSPHHILSGNAKPIALVQLYQKTRKIEDLHSEVQDCFHRYGFTVTLNERYKERLTSF